MATTHAPARLTNIALGELIGLDHTSASRLRRGERGCSVGVMVRMEELFGWPVREQYAAFVDGSFPAQLEERLVAWTSTRPADSGASGGLDG